MLSRILFITGTDTGVGKTVFATLLTRYLRARGLRVAALKPICSGGREDALWLHEAAARILPLDSVNPWYFRAPLAPLLAAREEQKKVSLNEVVAHLRCVGNKYETVIVEGAGGLLSPLGEGFDSRDLIVALRATPVVVCPNRLGGVNQVLLTLEALPRAIAKRTQIVLVNPPRLDLAARTNPELLAGFVNGAQIHALDCLGENPFSVATGKQLAIRKKLNRFAQAIVL